MAAVGTTTSTGSLYQTASTGSSTGSASSLVSGLMNRLFGPKLNPDDPAPPIDRDVEVEPHLIQWPPAAPSGSTPSTDDGGSSSPAVPPQGAIPCTAVLSPGPNSPDPLSCGVNVPDPNGGVPDTYVIPCSKVINQGDNSYCVPQQN